MNELIINNFKIKSKTYFNEIANITSDDYNELARLGEELSWFDVVSMIIIGIIGGLISNNEQLKRFLDDIHTDAISNNPKTILGKILYHKGDIIDKTTRK